MATRSMGTSSHQFHLDRVLVDRNKGPVSDFWVQLDKIFIGFEFSYPDTHTLFRFPITSSILFSYGCRGQHFQKSHLEECRG